MIEQHEAQSVAIETSPNLGERLQEARERKKISTAEAAAQLRFNKDIVVYLESQQWDKLPGRTYARGYFANYVKFLGLPHEEMLALFNHEYSVAEPVIDLKQYSHPVKHKTFPWAKLMLLTLLAVILWFAYQQWQLNQSDLSLSFFSDSPVAVNTFSATVQPIENDSESQEDAIDALPGLKNEIVIPVEEQEVVSAEYEFELSSNESAVDATPVASESPEQLVIEDMMVTQAGPHVQLSFNGQCWLEVTNSDSQVVVSKMMEANQTLELDSGLPLTILLGRASVATVKFNGEIVELAPYIQGDVARLTLGVES